MARACLKIVNTPKQRAFFCHTSLNFLVIRQDACENLPCLAKNSSLLGISPIIKQALEQFPEIMRKRKREQGAQGKAEDAGGLTPVKDDNAALHFLDR